MAKKLSCPWCGGVMDSGELQSERFIRWSPREQKLPNLLSWEGIRELCSPLTGNIRIPSGDGWENPYGQIPAYHCPKCKVFLFQGMLKEDEK